ncbi:unnamed protein product [Allacma fusca]|uniref:Uncharacterized protein n=1 Tax=Allacma fusca TaxID=39272 RepID=A0A8J2K325_9HEXA|nr:unnamed protein product [Allacma fusca]
MSHTNIIVWLLQEIKPDKGSNTAPLVKAFKNLGRFPNAGNSSRNLIPKGTLTPEVGDTCKFHFNEDHVPEYLELCDTLNTYLLCYKNNKSECLNSQRAFFNLYKYLEPHLAEAILSVLHELELEGYALDTLFDKKMGKCALTKASICPIRQFDLRDWIDFPGVDEVSKSVNRLKCRSDLQCTERYCRCCTRIKHPNINIYISGSEAPCCNLHKAGFLAL